MRSADQGELAVRARQKAARAAAKRPESLNEAVVNRMDKMRARSDAENLLNPPEELVASRGEVIRTDFRLPHIVDTLKEPNMIGIIASEHRLDLAACVSSRVAEAAERRHFRVLLKGIQRPPGKGGCGG
jgi:hypothetical protein